MNIHVLRYIVQIVVYTIYKMIVSKILLDINLKLLIHNSQLFPGTANLIAFSKFSISICWLS